MHTTNLFVVRLKKAILPFCFCLFVLLLLVFSKSNLASSKSGLLLWANSIVPSLLPFFVATELLSHTFIVPLLGRVLNNIMRPVFNVPGEGAFALIMGIISGYPIGAKIVCDLYKNGVCNTIEAERLIAFTNNSGPLFIVGSVGASMFGDTRTGILLLITHILASLTVGVLFRFWGRAKCETKGTLLHRKGYPRLSHAYYQKSDISFAKRQSSRLRDSNINLSNLGEILAQSIINSIRTILLIGGFVVLFSVVVSMLNQSHIFTVLNKIIEPILSILKIDPRLSTGILSGFVEITNGIKAISMIHIKAISQNVIVSSFLLGFGGICVLLQVLSVISKCRLSAKPYIIGKVLHGIFAALYTYLFLNCGLFFNLNLWVS